MILTSLAVALCCISKSGSVRYALPSVGRCHLSFTRSANTTSVKSMADSEKERQKRPVASFENISFCFLTAFEDFEEADESRLSAAERGLLLLLFDEAASSCWSSSSSANNDDDPSSALSSA